MWNIIIRLDFGWEIFSKAFVKVLVSLHRISHVEKGLRSFPDILYSRSF